MLMPEAAREFSKIRIGDEESVKSFTEDFGSHYIKSLTVGDAVYQILALDRAKYQRARQEVLVEMRKNPRLLDELEFLTEGTQAITALSFRSIGALLPSVQAQDYYNEIVNTQLAL